MAVTIPEAELIGTLLESMAYGIYLIVFLRCSRVLHAKYTEGRRIYSFVMTAAAIFTLVTMHLVVDWIRAIRAFTENMEESNAPMLFFQAENSKLDLMKTSVYAAVTLVSDLLIVYRTFLVWGRSYTLITIPFLLFLVDIAMSAWATWSLTQVKMNDNVLLADVTARAKYFYAVTLALNLVYTLLISYRIWTIHLLVRGGFLSDRLSRIVNLLIESAAFYSALLMVLIITSMRGTPALFIILNCTAPVIVVQSSPLIFA